MRNDSKGIVSWPEEERPRERLLSKGAQAVTDAELVAILIRVGFKDTSAVELARQVSKRFGSWHAFKRLNEWLERETIQTRYQFNMISPKSYNIFFQKLRDGGLAGFRSELDVAVARAGDVGG